MKNVFITEFLMNVSIYLFISLSSVYILPFYIYTQQNKKIYKNGEHCVSIQPSSPWLVNAGVWRYAELEREKLDREPWHTPGLRKHFIIVCVCVCGYEFDQGLDDSGLYGRDCLNRPF